MAANKGGDSKQGLIIALVCFVLLTITLGVVSYYGYEGQAALDKKAKDETATATSAKKDRDWWKYRALAMAKWAGHIQKDELTDLSSSEANKASLTGDGKAAFDTEAAKAEKKLIKPGTKDFESYSDRADRLEKELVSTQDLLAKTTADLRKAEAKNKRDKDDYDQSVADLQKKQNEALEASRKAYAALEKSLEDKLAEFSTLNTDLASLRKKAEADTGDAAKGRTALLRQISDLKTKIDKILAEQKPVDLFKFDVPKGKIVRLDPKGELAWIDVGSADNVKAHQNLTFAIFGSTAGAKAGAERKGALEVVDVLGAHLSMAKITDVTDPNAHPLLTGDLLINPAWSPGNRTHVALAGLFDLTGEGRDNIEEFMRTLKREGTVVDAYLDLKDLTIKGDGMTFKTDYLIIGEQPGFGKSSIRLGDPRVERKTDILDKIGKMQVRATELGVSVVPLRRFVLLTGYKLPKGLGVDTGAGYDYIRPGETLEAKPATKKGDKPAAKEEKKDKEKDDEDK